MNAGIIGRSRGKIALSLTRSFHGKACANKNSLCLPRLTTTILSAENLKILERTYRGRGTRENGSRITGIVARIRFSI
jgi:hypothetical protein